MPSQEKLGEVVYVEPPELGAHLKKGGELEWCAVYMVGCCLSNYARHTLVSMYRRGGGCGTKRCASEIEVDPWF